MQRVFVAICFALGMGTVADAQTIDVAFYRKVKTQDPKQLRVFLAGVGEGLGWANADLQVRQQPLLFCPPQTMPLNPDNYIRLIDDELARGLFKSDADIGVVLLFSLKRAFPCN